MSQRRVIKLGGSLLDLSDLIPRFQHWRSSTPPATELLLVGGGPSVRGLRNLSGGQDDEVMHFQAIAEMFQNLSRFSDRALSGASPVSILSELPTTSSGPPQLYLFDCRNWCAQNRTLPRNWTTSSDSIAAMIAIEWSADELVLLKSTAHDPLTALTESNVVDEFFPHLLPRLPAWTIVNLRDDRFATNERLQA